MEILPRYAAIRGARDTAVCASDVADGLAHKVRRMEPRLTIRPLYGGARVLLAAHAVRVSHGDDHLATQARVGERLGVVVDRIENAPIRASVVSLQQFILLRHDARRGTRALERVNRPGLAFPSFGNGPRFSSVRGLNDVARPVAYPSLRVRECVHRE